MRIWFFDFDGTLSPIVPDRNKAVLHPCCAEMLTKLSQSPTDRVVIISSRALEDILPRVSLENIIVGGNSGMVWQLPGGCRVSPGADKEDILQNRRQELLPMITMLGNSRETEIEDKKWSIAIHIKQNENSSSDEIVTAITTWAEREKIAIHSGPNVLEVQLLPDFNKSVGTSFMANFLKIDPQKDTIFYAGDDQNDAVAMWWTLLRGGTAIMVGSQLDVPGATYVKDQQELAAMVLLLQESNSATNII